MNLDQVPVSHSNQIVHLTIESPQIIQPTKSEVESIKDNGNSSQVKKSGGRPKSFVWQYYTQHSDANVKSKRCEVSCNFCEARMLSRVEQMEAHLAQTCPQCPADVRQHMRDRIIAAKELSKAKKEAQERGDVVLKASAPLMQQPLLGPMPQPIVKRQRVDLQKEAQNSIPLRLRFPQVNTTPIFRSRQ